MCDNSQKVPHKMCDFSQKLGHKTCIPLYIKILKKAKSLNEISTEKPTLIQGDYNIGKKGNLLTLPAYTAFLLTEI